LYRPDIVPIALLAAAQAALGKSASDK